MDDATHFLIRRLGFWNFFLFGGLLGVNSLTKVGGYVFVEEGICREVQDHISSDELPVSLWDSHVRVKLGGLVQDLIPVCLRDCGGDVTPADVCFPASPSQDAVFQGRGLEVPHHDLPGSVEVFRVAFPCLVE